MKVIVVGGTGFIGTRLVQALLEKNFGVTVVTRNPKRVDSRWGQSVRCIEWNPPRLVALEEALDGQDALVNLAGEGIADSRWTSTRKKILRQSRIEITRTIVDIISHLSTPPRVLINASGIGYYGLQPPAPVDEFSGPGDGFLAELCVEWESEALKAKEYGVRVVCLRAGMVLGKGGGALAKMLPPFKMFVGGPIQPGTQPVSWIHLEDLLQLIVQALHDPHCKGPINAVSPHPVTMQEFCQTLGKVLGRPSWLPVPSWPLKVALGEMATLMTHGQTVKPTVVHKIGFDYSYPFLETALQSIVGKACKGNP